MHGSAVARHECNSSADFVKDHLVIAHRRSTDDCSIVLIIIDAHTPDTGAHFIDVLRGHHLQRMAVGKLERIRGKAVDLSFSHSVAVVIMVGSLGRSRRTGTPRAS